MKRMIRYLTIVVLAAVAMACAPAAPPTPTPAPPKPAPAAPAAPTAAPTAAPKPAAPAPTAAPAKPAAAAPTAAPAKPAAKEKVIMRLGWTIQGANAPFLLAWAKGWYEAEGLDVEIQEGKGSMTGFQTVASGADTFTYGDPGVVMQAIQQGLPVRGIALLLARSPMAVVAQKEANVKGPKDLEGKSVAVTPGDTAMVMLPALLKANKGDIAKVNQVSLDSNGKTTAFVGKRVDSATTFVNSSLVPMQKAVPDLTMFLYADYGVDTGGVVLVTNLPTMRERPQVVRGFTKATVRAFQYTRENKQEGIDAIMKRFPVADRALMEAQWDRTLALLDSDASKKAGPGVIFPELFSSNQDLLLEYGQLKEKRTIDQYFSNDFVK